jgi:hypothetical protein
MGLDGFVPHDLDISANPLTLLPCRDFLFQALKPLFLLKPEPFSFCP